MKISATICFMVILICQYIAPSPLYCKEPWQTFSLTPEERQSLSAKTSNYQISSEEISKWDRIAQELKLRYPPADGDTTRLSAYLYNAQKAFADESHAVSGSYVGTLDPISQHVLLLFFPNYQAKEEPQAQRDPYSNEIAKAVAKKINERFEQEKSQIHPVAITEDKDTWQGKAPYTGITIPTMQPWLITLKDFSAPPPPSASNSAFWQEQLDQVKAIIAKTTSQQNYEILFWAGLSPQGSGNWIDIATEHMRDQKIPIEKQLEVRAVLAAALMDASIAVFEAKYKYMTKRPEMLDNTIKTYIRTPNHPSYPAGHSISAAAAAAVLSHYFPENQKKWEKLAEDCSTSRITSGVHFPIDLIAGKDLGLKIGRFATSQ